MLRNTWGKCVAILLACAALGGTARAQTGSWTATGSLAEGRIGPTAARLTDGRVVVAGGYDVTMSAASNTAQVYNPALETWSSAGTMGHARLFPASAALSDGRFLIVGGSFGAGATAEIWDGSGWAATPAMHADRAFATATLLADGRVLVVGGVDSSITLHASAEIFDPAGPAWTATAGSMITARFAHAAVRLADGRVLVAGGADSASTNNNKTEIWNPASGLFTAGPIMSVVRSQMTMTLLSDGRVLIAGGVFIGSESVGADIYDPVLNTMTPVPMAQARYAHGAGILADGRVLVFGGVNSPPAVPLASSEIFDPATNAFSAEASMSLTRSGHAGVALADGSVLAISGNTVASYVAGTATCERFTPAAPPANDPPTANAGADQTVEATGPGGASVTLDGSGSSDPDDDALTFTWTGTFGSVNGASATVTLPLGIHTITLTVDDGNGHTASDDVVVTVQDTTDPVLTASATPSVLWPPNHKMVAVAIKAEASDTADPAVTCSILSVTSNEPVNGPGDGDTNTDWELTGGLTLKLRAERSGTGSGRIYTVTVQCTDASGNTTTEAVTVTVPKSKP